MTDTKPTHHIDPTILNQARELRRAMTPQETQLWRRLRSRRFYGLKFRRQQPIFRFILDFYCPAHHLAIEVDGDSHTDPAQAAYDQARTAWLQARGYRLIRFTNREVANNLDGVLTEIVRQCGIAVD